MKSSISSDSPADASTCNIPRPSSSFPSSFTPFYPRAQQYYGYPGSGVYYYGEPPAQADSNVPDRYNQDCRGFYGQSDCASLEEYEEQQWMPECSYPSDSWNLQWSNPPNYVDDSAFTASESSLHNSPPNLLPHNTNTCAIGNNTYVSHHEPTSFLHNNRVLIAATSAFASHTLPVQSSCSSSKKISITRLESDIFENQAGSTGIRIEAPKISPAENLNRKSISFKSTQMLSAAVANDKQANQQFTKVKDSYSSPAHNGDINDSNNEDHLIDNIYIGGTVRIPANLGNSCSSFEHAGCSSFSAHSRASHTNIAETHSVGEIRGQHEDASPISSHVNHSQMIQSTEGKVCQSSKGTSTTNVSDGCADAGSLHERKNCVYNAQDTDKSDGNKLLAESIYHLSLFSKKKSSTAHESFDSKDLAIMKSIHMLCLSLTQDSVIEKDEKPMEQQINQGSAEIMVNNGMEDDMGSIYSILECLNPLVNGPQGTSSFECSSCKKAEGTEVCKHISTVAEKYGVQDEKPSIENHLSQLQVEFLKLQDEIAYERAESNDTVSMYKNLWSEAHAKLEAFKLEMLKIKDDLNGMKDLFQKLNNAPKLKDTGHTKARPDCIMNSCLIDRNESNFCNKSEDAAIRHNSGNPEISGQGLTEHNYMLKETVAAIVSSKGDHKFLQKENFVDPQIAMYKWELKDSVKESMNLESEVSQRLSMLLARPEMVPDTSCTDEEPLSDGFNNLYGCSKYVLQGDQSEVSKARHEVGFKEITSSSETSAMGDTNAKPVTVCDACLPAEYLMKCNADQLGLSTMGSDELWECQEDEIEIICLRPSYADNKLVYAKGETEWEHVEIEQKGFLS